MKTFSHDEETAIVVLLNHLGHEIRCEVEAQGPLRHLSWNRVIGKSIRRTLTWLDKLEETPVDEFETDRPETDGGKSDDPRG